MLRRILSIFFLLIGLFFLFYPVIEKLFFNSKQEQLVEAFENLGKTDTNGEAISPSEVQVNTEEGKSRLIDGAKGILRIPKINLEMVIFDGASEQSLKKGIGIIEPDKKIGVNNVGLAGHRSTTPGKQFNQLDELAPRDVIEVKTEESIHQFEVIKTFVVNRKAVEVLNDGQKPLLTLVTCTPIGKENPTDRLIVQAKLITEK